MTDARLACVHQSDADCLARFHANVTDREPSGAAATIGTIAHACIETYTREQAEHPSIEPMMVVRRVVKTWAASGDPAVTSHVVEQVIEIMAAAFGTHSELDFKLRGAGWQAVPEWRWALDAEFKPIAPCPKCEGGWRREVTRVDPEVPMMHVEEHECATCGGCGWSSAPAYEGTVDHLEWHASSGKVIVRDWKSVLVRESSEDVHTDRQARYYALAVLAHFEGAREVTFEKVFLRHGYSARWTFKRDEPWHEATRAVMSLRRQRRLDAIEMGEWPETLGPDCRWCPLLHRCAAQADARRRGTLPEASWPERARTFIGLKAQVADLKGLLESYVRETGEPIPLETPDGEVLGKAPVTKWTLVRDYDVTMAELEGLGMTPEMRVEWFRYCLEKDVPSRVRKALDTLVGKKSARALIETGQFIEPVGAEEFAVHIPPEVEVSPDVPASPDLVDDEIREALARDPDRARRVAEEMLREARGG